ncbi:MAG: HPr family phosphocarrier protein [Acidobacteriota bacterium]
MVEQIVEVRNQRGLHARAAAKLVRTAARFQCDIKLSKVSESQAVDGKSILGILLLAARKGTKLKLTLKGADEKEALRELVALFEDGFGEED